MDTQQREFFGNKLINIRDDLRDIDRKDMKTETKESISKAVKDIIKVLGGLCPQWGE